MLNFNEIQEKNKIFFAGKNITINDFKISSLIGSGGFSTVYKVKTKNSDTQFAMKKIDKHKIIQNDLESQLHSEIKILCTCDHENIISLYCALEDEEYVYLIMEYADSGTLYQRLKKKQNFNEKIVAKYMACILKAINHLHTRVPKIIHRDLKPENILIHQGKLMISDFGWSSQHKDSRTTFCGTYEYLSPEMIQGVEYDEKIDIWSLGIIMFELLTGRTPFKPHNAQNMHIRQVQRIIEQNVVQNKLDIDTHISIDCKEVLLSMLEPDPNLRPSAIQLYTYPFFKNQGQNKKFGFRYKSFFRYQFNKTQRKLIIIL